MTSSELRSSLSWLPFELVEEILYRIPIESLVRFKPVCKQWYTLFNDKRFIYKLFDLSQERYIQLDSKSVEILNMETKARLRLPAPDELQNYYLERTAHCNGLLLCKCMERGKYGDASRKLAVLNPLLSQLKWIEPSNSYGGLDVYGFGYDNVSRDNYKILKIIHKFGKSPEIEIYEYKTKLWRSVDATLQCGATLWKYVSINGNMYWIARKEMFNSKVEFIQSFDFSTETFKPICGPKGTDRFHGRTDDHTLVLSDYQGYGLCLLHEYKHVKIDVWVTNKVADGDVSWSKYFFVTCPDLPIFHSRF